MEKFCKALEANEKGLKKLNLIGLQRWLITFFSGKKILCWRACFFVHLWRQIPEIAETKIQGLKKFYGVSSKEGLEFFEAHKSADVIHRAECEKLLDSLSKEEQEKAERASLLTARYLWNFLSGMTSKHKLENIAA